MGGEGGCEGRVESIIRINLLNCFKLIKLVKEILQLVRKKSGKSQ